MRTSGRLAVRVVGAGVGALLLTLVTTLAEHAQAQTGGAPDPTVLVGAKAPSLTGPNIAGPGQVDLAKYGGKPVVVVFWLNTCPHCRRDLPKINAYQRKLGRQAQIVSVALNRPDVRGPKGFETPAAAVKTLRLTIPTVLYEGAVALNPAPGEWAVAQTPTVYIVDRAGLITTVLQPDSNGEVTVNEINRALAATDCGCALRSGPRAA
jgi:thiol-disulfide isomerase/thioredoxin